MDSNQTVLIIDDEPSNLAVLSELLGGDCRVRVARSGERGLAIAAGEPRPDLVLLDIMMPSMDGYDVLRALKRDPATEDIPVIFVTARGETAEEERGLAMGAVDYITKPVVPAILRARVRAHLALGLRTELLRENNDFLEAEVNRRMADNQVIQDVSIRALAYIAETRDPETGNHILRTQGYVGHLAQRLAEHPQFSDTMNEGFVKLLVKSAPLHDIGKVGIPDAVLLKPGPLDDEERAIMQTHAAIGARAIERAEQEAGRPVKFLRVAKEIAHWHHERWDGGGYPDGLRTEHIPVSARLMALADVFDAVISARVYKRSMSFGEAYEVIAGGRGTQFDPAMTDVFIDHFDSFTAIAKRYRDEGMPKR